jgi:uncharacterized Tic20 family protein
MKEFIKKHNTGIFIGLISTMIFIYLLQPILEFLGNLVVKVGSKVSENYVDKIFTQISHLELMDFGFLFFVVSLTFGGMIMAASTVYIWKRDNDSEEEEKDEKDYTSVKRKIPMTIMLIISLVIYIVVISTKAYQLSLITSFKQHLRIISPYITTQEEKILLSEWSLIGSKNDYDLVYFKLNNVAKKNKIELPDNSIYALDEF